MPLALIVFCSVAPSLPYSIGINSVRTSALMFVLSSLSDRLPSVLLSVLVSVLLYSSLCPFLSLFVCLSATFRPPTSGCVFQSSYLSVQVSFYPCMCLRSFVCVYLSFYKFLYLRSSVLLYFLFCPWFYPSIHAFRRFSCRTSF